MIVFIIGLIFLVISIICLVIISDKSESKLSKIAFIFIIMLAVGAVLITIDDSPKPIDVYRNKTTLQITYKIQGLDTLSKDTLVVWK